jgi:hypothetical protein
MLARCIRGIEPSALASLMSRHSTDLFSRRGATPRTNGSTSRNDQERFSPRGVDDMFLLRWSIVRRRSEVSWTGSNA